MRWFERYGVLFYPDTALVSGGTPEARERMRILNKQPSGVNMVAWQYAASGRRATRMFVRFTTQSIAAVMTAHVKVARGIFAEDLPREAELPISKPEDIESHIWSLAHALVDLGVVKL